MKSFGRIAASAVAASALAISSVAEETAVAFDFEDLQAQSAAQEDKVDKARTVLHEIFSNYCVEKLVKASVNIRDDGRPDVEVDPDTKNFQIRFKLAVKEDALNEWITSSQAKLTQIADTVEEDSGDNIIWSDECRWDGKKYIFDKRIRFMDCVRMFTPATDNMFRGEIVSKTGEVLKEITPFFLRERNHYSNKWQNPLPEGLPSSGTHDSYTPILNFGKCDFLSKIKEIRCSYGRFDDSKFPEMEKTHPVVQVPLKYGVSIDMVEVSPGLFCSKFPFTSEQAFACDIGVDTDRIRGYMRFVAFRTDPRKDLFQALKVLNELPPVRESGWEFRIPTETEWVHAAKGGSDKDATFGKLPDGRDQLLSAPGWMWDGYDTFGEPKTFVEEESWPLGQKMPNAYGLHDMVGLYRETCIAESKYGDNGGEKYCGRLAPFAWKGYNVHRKSLRAVNDCVSLRLFATKKSSK